MWSGITPRFAPRSWDARLGARRAVQLAKQATCNDAVRPNPPVQIGEVIPDHILSSHQCFLDHCCNRFLCTQCNCNAQTGTHWQTPLATQSSHPPFPRMKQSLFPESCGSCWLFACAQTTSLAETDRQTAAWRPKIVSQDDAGTHEAGAATTRCWSGGPQGVHAF